MNKTQIKVKKLKPKNSPRYVPSVGKSKGNFIVRIGKIKSLPIVTRMKAFELKIKAFELPFPFRKTSVFSLKKMAQMEAQKKIQEQKEREELEAQMERPYLIFKKIEPKPKPRLGVLVPEELKFFPSKFKKAIVRNSKENFDFIKGQISKLLLKSSQEKISEKLLSFLKITSPAYLTTLSELIHVLLVYNHKRDGICLKDIVFLLFSIEIKQNLDGRISPISTRVLKKKISGLGTGVVSAFKYRFLLYLQERFMWKTRRVPSRNLQKIWLQLQRTTKIPDLALTSQYGIILLHKTHSNYFLTLIVPKDENYDHIAFKKEIFSINEYYTFSKYTLRSLDKYHDLFSGLLIQKSPTKIMFQLAKILKSFSPPNFKEKMSRALRRTRRFLYRFHRRLKRRKRKKIHYIRMFRRKYGKKFSYTMIKRQVFRKKLAKELKRMIAPWRYLQKKRRFKKYPRRRLKRKKRKLRFVKPILRLEWKPNVDIRFLRGYFDSKAKRGVADLPNSSPQGIFKKNT
jgi:hypothetical protein